jgi:hypothetical protein
MASSPKNPGPKTTIPDMGKGDVKAALAAAGSSNIGTVRLIPLDHIKVMPGFQPRIKESPSHVAKVASIAQSILANGFYGTKPLSGFVGKDGDADVIYLTDGHTRLEAVELANELGAKMEPPRDPITALPMLMKSGDVTQRELTIGLVKENDGEKLSMMALAIVAHRLLKDGMTEDEVAEAIEVTPRYFKDLMMIISAPKAVREIIKAEKMSGTEAVRIMRKAGDKDEGAEIILARVKAAATKGKEKVTRKDSAEGTKGGTVKAAETGDKVKMAVTKTEWAVSAGHEFPLSDIKRFKALLPNTDWYSLLADKEGYATATEDFKFTCSISQPKKEEPKTPKTGEAAPAKKGGKKSAAPEPAGEDEAGDAEPDAPTEDLTEGL